MSLTHEWSDVPEERAAELANEAELLGIHAFVLDGLRIVDAASFHDEIADLLSFPAYYGRNFDAFDECITDLGWLDARPHRLVFMRPELFELGDPKSFAIAASILDEASERWARTSTPLEVVMLRATPSRA